MEIKSQSTAEHFAKRHFQDLNKLENCIVSVGGDIHANVDLDATCKTLDTEKVKYFIVKGSVKETKKNGSKTK